MAKFKIGIKTTVAQLKKQFRDEVGGELRVYDGGRKADDSDLLVSLGATKGTLECRTSRTVGKFEEAMLKELNLKVKVFTKDDWVKVLDGITLSKVADIPRQAKKSDMESQLSYKRDDAAVDEAEAVSVPEELVGMPIIDITLDSADIFHNYEEELENCHRFTWPAIAVLIYDAENGGTWVMSSRTDTDETMIAAKEWIDEEYEYLDLGYDDLEEAFETMEYYQSTFCKAYGINDVAKDSDELYGAIGVALNQLYNGSDGGRHTNWYSWHLEAEKVLFRVRNNGNDHTEIFIVTSDEVFEPVDCTTGQVDELIRRFKTAVWGNGSCFEGATDFSNGVAWVKIDGKWGLIDKSGKEVVKPKYDEAGNFSEDLAWVKLNEKYGFIDNSGKEVIKPKYDGAGNFSEGLAGVKIDGKWGFIDKIGKEVVKPKYDWGESFRAGLAKVKLDGKWGFIDKTGKEVVKPKYGRIDSFSEDLASVELDGKYGFIDKTGKEIVKPKYDSSSYDFHDSLACVKLDGKYGFIDKSGKEVVKPKYDSTGSFSECLASVQLDGKYGFIDKSGKEVVKPKYDRADSFSEGLASVKLDGKYGFIDKSGKEVVKPKYDRAGDFSEGRAWVKLDWDYGYIDKTGKEVVKLKYEDASNFCNGLAKVGAGGGSCCKVYGFIDKSGKEVIKPKYDSCGSLEFSDGLAIVKLNGKCGFVDESGKEVIEPKYDEAGRFCDGLAKVKIGDDYGFIDKTGNFAF